MAEAWPSSFTAINIMSGFKKSGVYPLNPREVTDRQLAPSKALCPQPQPEDTKAAPTPGSPLFSPEQEAMYQRRYEERYDISDPSYIAWLKIYHPEAEVSGTSSIDTSSLSSGKQGSNSSDILSEVLVLPEPQARPATKRKTTLTKKTVCITEDVLENMRLKEIEKKEAEEAKKMKQLERNQKKKKREKKRREEDKAKAMGKRGKKKKQEMHDWRG